MAAPAAIGAAVAFVAAIEAEAAAQHAGAAKRAALEAESRGTPGVPIAKYMHPSREKRFATFSSEL